MIEFGKTLKAAREAKGLSVAAVAEATHMMSRIVEDLENEDFSKFPAPIYGRGFVKLYCEAVGLDPKPFVAEFMEIFSGNRDPAIRERPVAAQPEPTPEAEELPPPMPEEPVIPVPPPEEPAPEETVSEEPVTEEPVPEEPIPEQEPLLAPEPEPEPQDEIPPELRDLELFNPGAFAPPPPPAPPEETVPPSANPLAARAFQGNKEDIRFTRYSAPLRDQPDDLPNIRPMIGRIAVLIGGALLILWALFAGLRALYRATTAERPETTASVTETQPESPAPESASVTPPSRQETVVPARTSRTPYPVDPLYID